MWAGIDGECYAAEFICHKQIKDIVGHGHCTRASHYLMFKRSENVILDTFFVDTVWVDVSLHL